MTINELFNECKMEIEKGNGDKEIFISNDDEGNGYHRLFYSFMQDEKNVTFCIENMFDLWERDADVNKIAILG